MKNSIHDYYDKKHNEDPKLTFKECIDVKYSQLNYRHVIYPTAVAATFVITLLFTLYFKPGSESTIPLAELQETAGLESGLAAQASDNDESGLREPEPRPRRENPIIPIVTVPPEYPAEAETAGIEGWVLVNLTVSAEGDVLNPYVEDAEPAEIFNESALAAVRQFKYQPPMIDGEIARVEDVRYLFRFYLDE
jgi:protein TonB